MLARCAHPAWHAHALHAHVSSSLLSFSSPPTHPAYATAVVVAFKQLLQFFGQRPLLTVTSHHELMLVVALCFVSPSLT